METMKKRKIIMATGGFDPIHEGHIRYLKAAREMGDMLIVGLNSDEWLMDKKGYCFYNNLTRMEIFDSLRMVDDVLLFEYSYGSAIAFIEDCIERYGRDDVEYWFVNGGDRTSKNIPENVPQFKGIVNFKYGVGGRKKLNASSKLVDRAKELSSVG